MKTKLFSVLSLSVLALVMFMSVVSALVITPVLINAPTTVDHGEDVTVTFSVTYTGYSDSKEVEFSDSSTNFSIVC